jgi:hypothetical protein
VRVAVVWCLDEGRNCDDLAFRAENRFGRGLSRDQQAICLASLTVFDSSCNTRASHCKRYRSIWLQGADVTWLTKA